jgi:HTH-type transcriptional regulator/antitoxin HigA
MLPKIIKTEEQYELALARIDELMDAEPNTPEGDELELLAMLVEHYEREVYPMELPDAVSAITFRMEQEGLKQKDLIEYIGSKSKVSEVLSGKRPLSLAMIRNLNAGLGIPADVLLQEPDATLPETPEGLDWSQFPLNEILKRKWIAFTGTLSQAKENVEELLSRWAAPLGTQALQPALMRQHIRGRNSTNAYPLAAWRIRVSLLAMEQDIPAYTQGTVTPEFARDLVKLSYLDNGPVLAREYLLKNGIHFVVEPHLPTTHLDGAVMMLPSGAPVIALTLRYDRLDNFWFTLCHELAHLALHLGRDDWELFYDDLESHEENELESEADRWASEALIPLKRWHSSTLSDKSTIAEIVSFAEKERIHPAIPAGRIRREHNNYKKYSKLVGKREVREAFGEMN